MLGRLLASKRRPYVPRLHDREIIRIDLSGTWLTMRLPPHTVPDMSDTPPSNGPINIYDLATYDHTHDRDGQREAFPLKFIVRRAWKVFLSPFHDRGGYLYMPVSVVDASRGNRHGNCLDQQDFEGTIIAYLTNAMGPGNATGNVHVAPNTWAPCAFGDSHGIKLTAIESPKQQPTHVKTLYFMPIGETHFALFQFLPIHFLPGDKSQDFYNKLIENLVADISIKLPDRHISTARDFIDQGKKYSTKRQPENWVYPESSPIDSDLQSIYREFATLNDDHHQ